LQLLPVMRIEINHQNLYSNMRAPEKIRNIITIITAASPKAGHASGQRDEKLMQTG